MEKPATEVTMAKERGINMVQFQGFKTKAEAQAFVKTHGGMLCYEKSEIEPRGKNPQDYRDCVAYGGLSREYPYAVQWHWERSETEI
jgi:hypothetical protein